MTAPGQACQALEPLRKRRPEADQRRSTGDKPSRAAAAFHADPAPASLLSARCWAGPKSWLRLCAVFTSAT